MIADTLELYRKYTGETFDRIKSFDTMADMWEDRWREYSDLTAVVDDGKEYTFAQLAEDVAQFPHRA